MTAVQELLESRRRSMNPSWLAARPDEQPAPARVLDVGIRNYGDDFVFMLASLVRRAGHRVALLGSLDGTEEHDVHILGPGPGDPGDTSDPEVSAISSDLDVVLAREVPFLAVCLSHQVLARRLGFRTRRRAVPNQGTQQVVNYFGTARRLAFYNSFSVVDDPTRSADGVEVSADGDDVIALRGDRFWSLQFHPESILSIDGPPILEAALDHLGSLGEPVARRRKKEHVHGRR